MPLVAGQEPKRYRWRLGLRKGRGALPGDLCQGTTCWHSGLEPPGGGGVLAKGSFKGPGPGQVSRCQGLHRPHGMWSEEAASAQVLPTWPTRHRAPKGSGCHPCSRGQWRMCRDDPRFPPPPATPRPRPPQPGRANTPPGEIVAPIQCSSANQQPSWESLSRGRRQLIVWGGLKPCSALSGQRGNLRAATQALS